MGKRDYALKLYGDFRNVYDLSRNDPENISAGLVTDIHEGAKSLLMLSLIHI